LSAAPGHADGDGGLGGKGRGEEEVDGGGYSPPRWRQPSEQGESYATLRLLLEDP
jgi:hypothetical protein